MFTLSVGSPHLRVVRALGAEAAAEGRKLCYGRVPPVVGAWWGRTACRSAPAAHRIGGAAAAHPTRSETFVDDLPALRAEGNRERTSIDDEDPPRIRVINEDLRGHRFGGDGCRSWAEWWARLFRAGDGAWPAIRWVLDDSESAARTDVLSGDV